MIIIDTNRGILRMTKGVNRVTIANRVTTWENIKFTPVGVIDIQDDKHIVANIDMIKLFEVCKRR